MDDTDSDAAPFCHQNSIDQRHSYARRAGGWLCLLLSVMLCKHGGGTKRGSLAGGGRRER
ncbi:MAG: hypothetical protein Q4D42_00585 [Eubacteriales bacterium]|nr:hypothetical protein [Eubacteriales bacterium]